LTTVKFGSVDDAAFGDGYLFNQLPVADVLVFAETVTTSANAALLAAMQEGFLVSGYTLISLGRFIPQRKTSSSTTRVTSSQPASPEYKAEQWK
jgi:hypothetical protein